MKRQTKPLAPVLDTALVESIATAFPAIAPAPARAAAMRGKLLARVDAERRCFVTVRNGQGIWMPLAPKVAMKPLDDDGEIQSFLLRLDGGGKCPAHDHAGDELCYVVEGDCRLGDLELAAGDFHLARAGTQHGVVSSRGGCVLFIRVPTGTELHF